ncbi:Pyrroline-5-carboxylate reductase [Thermodesulfovibrio sp. N1]|uniref:pyrroline-5-carboxylate reductase n=1 Tax=unclassified Thermodesulfovibrio TaxID=2645936 RepID=UPI00083B8700|nr:MULTISPECIES: pyrroline-5-carboxylate reductase [unclassified Thermodesulfovibrio]MDI1472360.1 pyrroline-5-carboxylate reductase [Thermodesulfovibrio sp. 1176]ODA43362.1 Pyrroline-5-carboxylate reductase [Thermodesulfovibrio sp. N1]
MIGFIGGGNMAEALIRGLIKNGKRNIIVSDPVDERRRYLEKCYGIKTTSSNIDVVNNSEIIVIAVKPQNILEVLEEIKEHVKEKHTVVSIAAGIPLNLIKNYLKTDKLIRAMPNLAAIVGESMTVLAICECLEMKIVAPVRDIFMGVGKVITLPEHYMNLVTALSGSGPGFLCYIVEQFMDVATELGLAEETAKELIIQTFIGTAKLLDSGIPPDKIRQKVTSPGGTTEAGLRILSSSNLREILFQTLQEATKRAQELSKREE